MYADKFHSETTPPYLNSYGWYRKHISQFGEDKAATFDSMAAKFGLPNLMSLQLLLTSRTELR